MTKTTVKTLQWALWFAASVLVILAFVDMHHDRREAECRRPYRGARP